MTTGFGGFWPAFTLPLTNHQAPFLRNFGAAAFATLGLASRSLRSSRRLERLKGIEPSSSAWKIVCNLNDFNEFWVKWQPNNRL
jgi:hypothetical protein